AAPARRRLAIGHRHGARSAERRRPACRRPVPARRAFARAASLGDLDMKCAHSMPFGAELVDGSARFSLWAPAAKRVELHLGDRPPLEMERRADGFHVVSVANASAGDHYTFAVDAEPR